MLQLLCYTHKRIQFEIIVSQLLSIVTEKIIRQLFLITVTKMTIFFGYVEPSSSQSPDTMSNMLFL
jgi:hypothetical protein